MRLSARIAATTLLLSLAVPVAATAGPEGGNLLGPEAGNLLGETAGNLLGETAGNLLGEEYGGEFEEVFDEVADAPGDAVDTVRGIIYPD